MCRSRTEWKISDISAWKIHSGSAVSASLPGEAVSEKPQSLDWVDGVHRDLQRQMHIILVEKNERLLDKYSPLIEGQFPGVAEKIRQQSRGAQLLPDRLARRAGKGWSLLRHSTIYCV